MLFQYNSWFNEKTGSFSLQVGNSPFTTGNKKNFLNTLLTQFEKEPKNIQFLNGLKKLYPPLKFLKKVSDKTN